MNFQTSTIHTIDALSESTFPGIFKTLQELLSWEWIIAKTPSFTLDDSIQVERGLIKASTNPQFVIGTQFYTFSNDYHSQQLPPQVDQHSPTAAATAGTTTSTTTTTSGHSLS